MFLIIDSRKAGKDAIVGFHTKTRFVDLSGDLPQGVYGREIQLKFM